MDVRNYSLLFAVAKACTSFSNVLKLNLAQIQQRGAENALCYSENMHCNLVLKSKMACLGLHKDHDKRATNDFSNTDRKQLQIDGGTCEEPENLPASATKCGRQNRFASAINSSVSNS